jgi:hypothetical protein
MASKQKNDNQMEAQSLGGKARAAALTAEQRSAIARQGALAKIAAGRPRATHRGNFLDEFGFDVECYVLDDEQKTAVISQRGMGAALGLGKLGGRLPRFVKGEKIARFVDPELSEKIDKPLIFQWSGPIPNQTVYGYDVTILIDICRAILQADENGELLERQQNMVKQARVILNASAKAGIKNLVYALAGYDATRAETIAAFKFYVREEAREYEKEFPDQLYNEWYRLYDLPKPEKNKPWKFKALTLDHVYKPLANSNGKILELTRVQKAKHDDRRKKLHQFLSDVGVKALRMHLGRLLGMAEASLTREQYEQHVQRVFGAQLEWTF